MDFSQPTVPRAIAECMADDNFREIYAMGNLIFVVDRDWGLRIFQFKASSSLGNGRIMKDNRGRRHLPLAPAFRKDPTRNGSGAPVRGCARPPSERDQGVDGAAS